MNENIHLHKLIKEIRFDSEFQKPYHTMYIGVNRPINQAIKSKSQHTNRSF